MLVHELRARAVTPGWAQKRLVMWVQRQQKNDILVQKRALAVQDLHPPPEACPATRTTRKRCVFDVPSWWQQNNWRMSTKNWIWAQNSTFGLKKGHFGQSGPSNGPPSGQTATYQKTEVIQSYPRIQGTYYPFGVRYVGIQKMGVILV